VSTSQGLCRKACNHANADSLEFLRGVLFEGDEYVIPSDVPYDVDDELEDVAA
jgi:hypothetical protein